MLCTQSQEEYLKMCKVIEVHILNSTMSDITLNILYFSSAGYTVSVLKKIQCAAVFNMFSMLKCILIHIPILSLSCLRTTLDTCVSVNTCDSVNIGDKRC